MTKLNRLFDIDSLGTNPNYTSQVEKKKWMKLLKNNR